MGARLYCKRTSRSRADRLSYTGRPLLLCFNETFEMTVATAQNTAIGGKFAQSCQITGRASMVHRDLAIDPLTRGQAAPRRMIIGAMELLRRRCGAAFAAASTL